MINEDHDDVVGQLIAARVERALALLEALYLRTHNPLHCWRAHLIANQHKRPVPQWALDYFARSADALLALIDVSPKAIVRALDLQGRGPSLISQAAMDLRNLDIVKRIVDLLDRPPRAA
jgi:hypothetical protein